MVDLKRLRKDLGEVREATGFDLFGGSLDSTRNRRQMSDEERKINKNENASARDDFDTDLSGYKTRYKRSMYERMTTGEELKERDMLENGVANGGGYGGNRGIPRGQSFYPGGQQPVYAPDARRGGLSDRDLARAQGYSREYNRPYYPTDGKLERAEVVAGLRNSGILRNPPELSPALNDLVNDVQRITGKKVTYPNPKKEGETLVNFDWLAEELTQYARTKPINLSALEAGDGNTWQALDAFLDSDRRRLGGTDLDAPIQSQQKQYQRDEQVENRIASLLQDVSLEKRKKMSQQVTAALQEVGVKVEGSPIEELSGWIAREKPQLAEKIRSGSVAESAAALRQAASELEAEAIRHKKMVNIDALPAVATQRSSNNVQPVVAQTTSSTPVVNNAQVNQGKNILTEAELISSIERGDMVSKVSEMKQHLNRLTGSRFSNNDDIREQGFLTTMTKTLNKNLDPKTLNDLDNGGAFNVEGTFKKIEQNMANRADVEKHRELFEKGMDNGAMTQITNTLLYKDKDRFAETRGTGAYQKMQTDLKTLGYNSANGLPASLREYFSDKLYNQQDFRTAPKEVQDFVKDVEAGKYKSSNPRTVGENTNQMQKVVEYIETSISFDLAKKEKSVSVAAPAVATPNNVTAQTVSNNDAAKGEEFQKRRFISDIAMNKRNGGEDPSNPHKDFIAQNQTEINNEIARQNSSNTIAWNKIKGNNVETVSAPIAVPTASVTINVPAPKSAAVAPTPAPAPAPTPAAAPVVVTQKVEQQPAPVAKYIVPVPINPVEAIKPQIIKTIEPIKVDKAPEAKSIAAPAVNPVKTSSASSEIPQKNIAELTKLLQTLPAPEQKQLEQFLKNQGIPTQNGDLVGSLKQYIVQKEPKMFEEFKKSEPNLVNIMGDFKELSDKIKKTPVVKETSAIPESTPTDKNNVAKEEQQSPSSTTTDPISVAIETTKKERDPMQNALAQAKGAGVAGNSTVSGGEEATNPLITSTLPNKISSGSSLSA